MEITLWKDKSNKLVDPFLFSQTAEKFAEQMYRELDKKCNKRTQLRKFYDEVLNFRDRVQKKPEDWPAILPLVQMIIAKAVYAKGRNLVSDGFVNFVRSGIKQIEEPEDLDVFATFFEAFMAFYRIYESN
ncbi:MAG: type III-A CRISPR-associated protein Csm2 [Desulfatibacillaceae bacterium]|nr:type III-A CRISPR-associated protein Csm2 [Desulfatibacillaceae bacterium]